jgi:hypothetical protein
MTTQSKFDSINRSSSPALTMHSMLVTHILKISKMDVDLNPASGEEVNILS